MLNMPCLQGNLQLDRHLCVMIHKFVFARCSMQLTRQGGKTRLKSQITQATTTPNSMCRSCGRCAHTSHTICVQWPKPFARACGRWQWLRSCEPRWPLRPAASPDAGTPPDTPPLAATRAPPPHRQVLCAWPTISCVCWPRRLPMTMHCVNIARMS